tara:strand:- start:28669 stop:29517 length:849 start_codon:yes stop_codon:yes gene_type:complete
MTKRLNNILIKSAEDTDLRETHLSIQIYLGGFSFCVYNPTTNEHIAFQRFEFEEKQKTPEKLLKEVQAIFEENKLLNQSYKKVIVLHQNELSTIVPHEYFDEGNLKDYLKQTVKVLPIDYISYDSLTYCNANVVYIPFVNINNYLFQKYGGFDFYHSSTVLIDLLQEKQKASENHKVYINIHQNCFELIVFNKQELLLVNNFDFQTAEDFIYYILFSLEQLEQDPNTIDVELLGDIEKESELYAIAYKYIRNVKFYNNMQLSKEYDSISKHSNFILLNHSTK